MSNPKLISGKACMAASKILQNAIALDALLKDYGESEGVMLPVSGKEQTHYVKVDAGNLRDFLCAVLESEKAKARELGVDPRIGLEGRT